MEPYYFQSMNKLQKAVYHAMQEGLLSMADEIQIPRVEPADLEKMLFLLRLDHPEIFWVTGFKYLSYPGSPNLSVVPVYLMDKQKVKEHRHAMEARIEKLVRPIKDKTPVEQELYIHDFICTQVHYDKLKKAYSHEIIGPLGQGVGVCEGIAKSVKALCDAAGLWCIIALCDNNPDKGIKYRHTWNIVRIKGQYYHLDVTFDATLSKDGEIRYDYFNLEDKKIFRDHEPLLYTVPTCADGDRYYYRQKKLSYTKEEDLKKRALQAATKGKNLTFHWRGGYLTGETTEKILRILEDVGKEKGKTAKIWLNYPQAVFKVSYSSEKGGGLTVEEAYSNEREGVL